jgi:hypothetical protein
MIESSQHNCTSEDKYQHCNNTSDITKEDNSEGVFFSSMTTALSIMGSILGICVIGVICYKKLNNCKAAITIIEKAAPFFSIHNANEVEIAGHDDHNPTDEV